jgi:endonuclease/exonuclease/phosphatase family metal-dependent hydrolase
MTLARCIVSFILLVMFALPVSAQNSSATADVRVMTFNIWLGGELVDFGRVVEVIRISNADIAGLQEPTGNTQRIADALGWHANPQTHIISRFPLIAPPDANGQYVYAQLAPGRVVAVANVHLTSNPYGPYEVRDGASSDDVLALEEGLRLVEIQTTLDAVAPLLADDVPVFLTGDFNAPSHRDWTPAAQEIRTDVAFPLEWPVSLAVEAVGFVDTFRAVHPDPVENPGITWTYGYPFPRLNADEVIDRIDFVYAANADAVILSEIVGDPAMPNTDIAVSPYPSDHRAVVSAIRVTPVEPPPFVAVDSPALTIGQQVIARYHAPAGETVDRLVLVPAERNVSEDALAWLPPYEASFFGSVTFGTSTLTAGDYDIVLVTEGDQEVSRSRFNLREPDAVPEIAVTESTVLEGQPITVTWRHAPANRLDWIGIYAAGEPDLYNGYYAYQYVNAQPHGDITFDADALGEAMLPPGDYEVRLMLDDGYEVLAAAPFTVAGN